MGELPDDWIRRLYSWWGTLILINDFFFECPQTDAPFIFADFGVLCPLLFVLYVYTVFFFIIIIIIIIIL